MANLDGKEAVKPTPFDAHEQATRGEHVETTKDSPDKDPTTVAEFPKAVDHVEHPSGVGLEPIVVQNAAEEQAHFEAKPADPRDETPAEEKTREAAEKAEEDAEDVQPRTPRKSA